MLAFSRGVPAIVRKLAINRGCGMAIERSFSATFRAKTQESMGLVKKCLKSDDFSQLDREMLPPARSIATRQKSTPARQRAVPGRFVADRHTPFQFVRVPPLLARVGSRGPQAAPPFPQNGQARLRPEPCSRNAILSYFSQTAPRAQDARSSAPPPWTPLSEIRRAPAGGMRLRPHQGGAAHSKPSAAHSRPATAGLRSLRGGRAPRRNPSSHRTAATRRRIAEAGSIRTSARKRTPTDSQTTPLRPPGAHYATRNALPVIMDLG